MTLLAVDIGNTRTKWALFRDGAIDKRGSRLHSEGAPCDWTPLSELPRPQRVGVVCVSGREWQKGLSEWIAQHWGSPVVNVRSRPAGFGVTSGYREPAKLGADRWAALVAARQQDRCGMVVVDAGSACTVDALGSDGRHRGGYIVPGVAFMRRSLVEGARGVSPLEGEPVTSGWGRDTASAIAGGIFEALGGLVERSLARLQAEGESRVRCIVTGGDGASLLPYIGMDCCYDPDLVLKGVALMMREESPAP